MKPYQLFKLVGFLSSVINNAPKAEAYLRRLIQNYWSRKTFDVDQNDVVKKFNPQSMLDALPDRSRRDLL